VGGREDLLRSAGGQSDPALLHEAERLHRDPAALARKSRPGWAFAIASGTFAAFFLFSTVVQYNDPDPLRWMLLYGSAAVVSAWAAAARLRPLVPLVIAAPALLWAMTLAPSVARQLPSLLDLTGSLKMMAPGVEETREALGLMLVAIWMAAIAWRNR
jgi:hypothetical protein